MRSQVISDHLSVLHHKSNSLQLAYVCDRISCYGDEIGKFARLDGAHRAPPAQQFRSVCRDRTNDLKRRHATDDCACGMQAGDLGCSREAQ